MTATQDAMAAFELAKIVEERRKAGESWLEFFRVPALSLGLYVLPTGGTDPQSPHGQDEIYYVVSGKAILRVDGEETRAEPGSILYVAAEAEHRFHSIEEELTLLVFFTPAYQRTGES